MSMATVTAASAVVGGGKGGTGGVPLDARRVDELLPLFSSLRFFHQLPRSLLRRFVCGMVVRRWPSERVLPLPAGDAQQDGEGMTVILKGSIAVYAERGREDGVIVQPTTAAKKDVSARLGTGGGKKSRAVSRAGSASLSQARRGTTAGPGPVSLPTSRRGSDTITGDTAPTQSQRGVSLVPDWVSSSSDDDDGESSQSSSSSSDHDDEEDAGESEEVKTARRAKAVEEARQTARRRVEQSAQQAQQAQEEATTQAASSTQAAQSRARSRFYQELQRSAQTKLECICTLQEGDCFGMLSLLENQPRPSVLICLDDVEVAVLERTRYQEIMKQLNTININVPVHAHVKNELAVGGVGTSAAVVTQQRCQISNMAKYLRVLHTPGESRTDAQLHSLISPLLPLNRLLQLLDARALQQVAAGMKYLEAPRAGLVLQQQDQEAEWIYVVLEGSISEHYKHPSSALPSLSSSYDHQHSNNSSNMLHSGSTTYSTSAIYSPPPPNHNRSTNHLRRSPSPPRPRLSRPTTSHSSPVSNNQHQQQSPSGDKKEGGAFFPPSLDVAAAALSSSVAPSARPVAPSNSSILSSMHVSVHPSHSGIVSPHPITTSASTEHGAPGSILDQFGSCRRLLLPGDLSPLPDRDVTTPRQWTRNSCTLLTREPCKLAKISWDYLAHVLHALMKPLKGLPQLRHALSQPGSKRSEADLDLISEELLGRVTLFQFKPAKLRRELAKRVSMQTLTHEGGSVVFAQGQTCNTESAFYILLSGSVSIHQKTASSSTTATSSSTSARSNSSNSSSSPSDSDTHYEDEDDASNGSVPIPVAWPPGSKPGSTVSLVDSRHAALPDWGLDILTTFGKCIGIGKAGTHFGEQALLSSLPRNLTIIARGPCELVVVKRCDYDDVFVPVIDALAGHAAKALQLLSRPVRTPPIVNQLVEVLKHVPYFNDMSPGLRTYAIRHAEIETVEGDTVLFQQGEPADYMYVLMSGSVGVHIQDKSLVAAKKPASGGAATDGTASSSSSAATLEVIGSEGEEDEESRELDSSASADAESETEADDEEESGSTNDNDEDSKSGDEEKDGERKVKNKKKKKKHKIKQDGLRIDTEADADGSHDDEIETSSSVSPKSSSKNPPRRHRRASSAHLSRGESGLLLASGSRGDVFTPTAAGQHALAAQLRRKASKQTDDAARVMAKLNKEQQAEAFKRRMREETKKAEEELKWVEQEDQQQATTGATSSSSSSASTQSSNGSVTPSENASAAAASISETDPLSVILSGIGRSGRKKGGRGRDSSAKGGRGGGSSGSVSVRRMQVGHMNPAERTEVFGPCVVVLPSGSVVGEVALTSAAGAAAASASASGDSSSKSSAGHGTSGESGGSGESEVVDQRARRTASIITQEPTFFIKLHGDVVSRITFGAQSHGGGEGSSSSSGPSVGSSGPAAGAGAMTQDAITNFLKSLDVLRVVKGSATGAGTGSHATFKRLAYHMRDRVLGAGSVLAEQGTRADSVIIVVRGSVTLSRKLVLQGVGADDGGMRAARLMSGLAATAVTGPSGLPRFTPTIDPMHRVITMPQVEGQPFQVVKTALLPPAATDGSNATFGATTIPLHNASSTSSASGSGDHSHLTSSSSSSSSSTITGIPLNVELTVLGSGEVLFGVEVHRGLLHSSTVSISNSSSDALVLQMKSHHFLNMFPARAVECLEVLGSKRDQLYAWRVRNIVEMKTREIMDKMKPPPVPLPPPLPLPINHPSAKAQRRQQEKERKRAAAAATIATEEKEARSPSPLRPRTSSSSLSPSRYGSSIDVDLPSIPATSQTTPPKRRTIQSAMGDRTLGLAPSITRDRPMPPPEYMAAATSRPSSTTPPGPTTTRMKVQLPATSRAISPEKRGGGGGGGGGISPPSKDEAPEVDVEAVARDIAELDPERAAANAPAIRARSLTSSQRVAVTRPSLNPPPVVREQPQLQSATLMQVLRLAPDEPAKDTLTPVQRALGYKVDPATVNSPSRPSSPVNKEDGSQSQQWSKRSSANSGGLTVSISDTVSVRPLSPSESTRSSLTSTTTSPGPANRSRNNSRPTSAVRPSTGGSSGSSSSSWSNRSSPSHTAQHQQQGGSSSLSLSVDPMSSWTAPPGSGLPSLSPSSRGSSSSGAGPGAVSVGRSMRVETRGGLGKGIEYAPVLASPKRGGVAGSSSSAVRTAAELAVLRESLAGKHMGSGGLLDLEENVQQQGAAAVAANAEANTPRGEAPMLQSEKEAAALMSSTSASPMSSDDATSASRSSGTFAAPASSPTSRTSSAVTSSSMSSSSSSSSSFGSQPVPSRGPSMRRQRSIHDMDVESRALVLMRAEKAQMLWESSEVARRGHRILEKVRPTSYNVSQEQKQAQLSRSLAWDEGDVMGQSNQSNAFLHAASPPLAAMKEAAAQLAAQAAAEAAAATANDEIDVFDPEVAALLLGTGGPPPASSLLPVSRLRATSDGHKKKDGSTSPSHSTTGSTNDSTTPVVVSSSASSIIRSLLVPLIDSNFTSLFGQEAPLTLVGMKATAKQPPLNLCHADSAEMVGSVLGKEDVEVLKNKVKQQPLHQTAASLLKAAVAAAEQEQQQQQQWQLQRPVTSSGSSHSKSAPYLDALRPSTTGDIVHRIGSRSRPRSPAKALLPGSRSRPTTSHQLTRGTTSPKLEPWSGSRGSTPSPKRQAASGNTSPALSSAGSSSSLPALAFNQASTSPSASASIRFGLSTQVPSSTTTSPPVVSPSKGATSKASRGTSPTRVGVGARRGTVPTSVLSATTLKANANSSSPKLPPHSPTMQTSGDTQKHDDGDDEESKSSESSTSSSPTLKPSELRSPLRHGRTSSLGSFLALSLAGVGRSQSLPPAATSPPGPTPSAAPGPSSSSSSSSSLLTSPSSMSRRASHRAKTPPGVETVVEEKETDSETDSEFGPSTPIQLMTTPQKAASRSPSLLAPPIQSSSPALSRTGSSPVPSASPNQSRTCMPPLTRSLSSLSPSAYVAGSSPAIRKTTFHDDRREAQRTSAKILADSAQGSYSRTGIAHPLPGARNPASCKDGSNGESNFFLSRAELDAQRRARVYSIKAHHVFEPTTAFSQALAAVAQQPDMMLAPKHVSKLRAREEKRVEEAVRKDGFASKILSEIKSASERTQG